jgi:hypothetical protein
LLSDKIVVKSVRVDAAEVTFEGGLGGNNLSKILDNVNAATGAGQSAEPAAKDQKAARTLQVDDFLITGAKVNVSLTGMGAKSVTVTLPDVHLTNLGRHGRNHLELTKLVLTRSSPPPPGGHSDCRQGPDEA